MITTGRRTAASRSMLNLPLPLAMLCSAMLLFHDAMFFRDAMLFFCDAILLFCDAILFFCDAILFFRDAMLFSAMLCYFSAFPRCCAISRSAFVITLIILMPCLVFIVQAYYIETE